MRLGTLSVSVLTVFLLAGCLPATAQHPTLQSFASVCDRSNEGQEVELQGYLRLPDALDSNTRVMLRLYPALSFHGTPVGVNMQFGNDADQVKHITSSYHDSDLQVRLSDGTIVPFGTRVRVTGRVSFPLTPLDFACQLDDPIVQKAQ